MQKTIHETISKVGIVAGAILVLLITVTGVISVIDLLFDLFGSLIAFIGTVPEQLRSAVDWLFSNPLVLIGILLIGGFVVFVLRNRAGEIEIDAGSIVSKSRELLENNIGYFDANVVRGSIEHDKVRWIGRYKRSGGVRVGPRACLYHGIKLRPAVEQRTEARSPNTSMSTDEKTSEYEDRAWENIAEREKVENEPVVDVLECPYDSCSFSILGDEYRARDEDAVHTLFENHFEQMRTGERDPFVKWRTAAEEDREFEPTPADIWDAYVPECDDPAVITNGSRFEETETEGGNSITCEELENHKQRAEGIDQVIEQLPSGLDVLFGFIFRSNYLKEKEKIREMMNQERKTCRERLKRIEQEYGSTVERTVTARYSREEPPIDNEVAERELDDAGSEVRELYTDLRIKYLSYDMRSWLSVIENDISAADEYVRELNNFAEHREKIEPQIEVFERRFEPYEDVEEYMTTQDCTVLGQMGSMIHEKLLDLHREVQLDLLPPDDTNWADERKARFTELLRLLPEYNEKFVEQERERYWDLFRTEHGLLNDEQQKAIVRNDHHNLVDASAGTGKTLTLTYRFLYLYRRGVPLDDIVAITFTNDAADEMESRIADELNGVDPHQLNISTCHSLANSIVGESILDSSSDEYDPKTIHSHYAREFIKRNDVFREEPHEKMTDFEDHHNEICDSKSIEERKPANKSSEDYLRKQYTQFLEKARGFDKGPDEICQHLTKDKIVQYHFVHAACAMLEAFNDYVESTNEAIDFPDMVQSATRIRRDNPEHFSGEYRHVLFDEYQDVTESDLEFVETFLHESEETHLFAVGDDWQSIYGFRGADPSFFIDFEERFNSVADTQLAINYRCPPAIVKAGEELMANSETDQNEKDVEAFNDSSVVPVMHKLGGIYENRAATRAVNLIEDALSEDDAKPKDVMVLSRNDRGSPFMNRIRNKLDDRGIQRIQLNDSDEMGDPDGVRIQSIHKSKGTEAEHVILVNATEKTYHGLPASEKENELLSPAIANTTDHYAEERRLFYVALTRTKHRLDVITHLGNESCYLKELSSYFEVKRSNVWAAEGLLGSWNYPSTDNGQPIKAPLACDGYSVELKTWDEKFTRKLEPGQRYRLSNIDPENNGWGAQIELDESVEIEELGST